MLTNLARTKLINLALVFFSKKQITGTGNDLIRLDYGLKYLEKN